MKNWLKALLSETILSIRLVAHLSFFERWDSASLCCLDLWILRMRAKCCMSVGTGKMRRKPGAA